MSLTSLRRMVLHDLPFKSTVSEFLHHRTSVELSIGAHISIVLFSLLIAFFPKFGGKRYDFEVIEVPKTPAKVMSVSRAPQQETKNKKAPRAIYGMSRKSMVADAGETVKAGNTVAKEIDETKMKKDDADTLPVPVDEYLVNSMPQLISEVRIPYPPDAKKQGIQGAVVMDILIDDQGNVRDANLVSGPSPDLNEAAMNAVVGFKFKPAVVQDKPVAVKIRYAYRFVLER